MTIIAITLFVCLVVSLIVNAMTLSHGKTMLVQINNQNRTICNLRNLLNTATNSKLRQVRAP